MTAHRPAIRPGVLFSPPLLRGPRTVHLLKHPDGAAFEVGTKEYFVISRCDGTRAQEDIAAEYAGHFGRRLGDENWARLLGLLGARGLLAGGPPAPAAEPGPPRTGTLWKGTWRLVADADRTTARLHRTLRPVLRPGVLLPLLAAMAAMLGVLAFSGPELLAGTVELFRQPVALLAVFTLLWFSTALHELAHGIAAQAYGGRVAEIGLRWRLPAAVMYCTVDTYPYLPGRRAKLVVAGAGAYTNLLFLLPFAVWWAVLPPGGETRQVLSGLLLLGSVQGLVNLFPIPPLDGYRIISHALGVSHYAAETRGYLRLRLRRGGAAATADYPHRARVLYTAYGLCWAVLVLVPVAGVITVAALLLAP